LAREVRAALVERATVAREARGLGDLALDLGEQHRALPLERAGALLEAETLGLRAREGAFHRSEDLGEAPEFAAEDPQAVLEEAALLARPLLARGDISLGLARLDLE